MWNFTQNTLFLYIAIETAMGHRVCDANGEWLWGNWTNYTACYATIQHMMSSNFDSVAILEHPNSNNVLLMGDNDMVRLQF